MRIKELLHALRIHRVDVEVDIRRSAAAASDVRGPDFLALVEDVRASFWNVWRACLERTKRLNRAKGQSSRAGREYRADDRDGGGTGVSARCGGAGRFINRGSVQRGLRGFAGCGPGSIGGDSCSVACVGGGGFLYLASDPV